MSERLSGLDIVKGAAIVLVVFGHVWRGLATAGMIPDTALFARIDNAIYLFHMPVFFFLSGLFFSAKLPPWAFLRSRVLLLLWPMVLWAWIDAGLRAVVGAPLKGKILGPMDVLLAPFPSQGIYWFLLTLFVLNLLAYIAAQFPKPVQIGLMAVLGLLAAMNRIDVSPFNSLWPSVIYMPDFFAGVIFSLLLPREAVIRPWLFLPAIPLFLLGEMLLALGWTAGSLIWAKIALASAGAGFILFFANLPGPETLCRVLAALGRWTMPIYLAHIVFTGGTRILLVQMGMHDLVLHSVIGTVAGIIGPLALLYLTRRFGGGDFLGFGDAARVKTPG